MRSNDRRDSTSRIFGERHGSWFDQRSWISETGIQPGRENECTGERRELFMKENFGSREMLTSSVTIISYAMS